MLVQDCNFMQRYEITDKLLNNNNMMLTGIASTIMYHHYFMHFIILDQYRQCISHFVEVLLFLNEAYNSTLTNLSAQI